MMYGPEKSDPAIVAMKPANKKEQSVAEPVEQRAGARARGMSLTPLCVQPVSATALVVYRLAFGSPRSFADVD